MVKNDIDQVRELRNATGAGIMDCKRALEEAKGDFQAAKDLLRKRGFEIAQKKSGRATKEGQIFSYVHLGGKIGVLVEIDCETDFVARNSEFQQFGRDIAMQVAAREPLFISREEVNPQWTELERELIKSELANESNPTQAGDIQERLDKRLDEVCLLDQKFIKDESRTIRDLLTELIAKLGEHVVIKRFRRFEVGGE